MIESLLDNDYYQFTMANCIHNSGDGDINVRYEFRNRTFAVPLARRIKLTDLHVAIERTRTLRFKPEELDYLATHDVFSTSFLQHLADLELPPVELHDDNGHLVMEYEGPWEQAIFWETPLLAIVSELYYRRFGGYLEEGTQRLREKIGYLNNRPGAPFVEMGTRRRYSHSWQRFVLQRIVDEIPHRIAGTSNVLFAREFDLPCRGTMAHQMFMVYAALFDTPTNGNRADARIAIESATHRVLTNWRHEYKEHPGLMTFLPDTFTTRAFFACVDQYKRDLLDGYHGVRQDSGDPFETGALLIKNLADRDHDPQTFRFLFSDNLDVRKMSLLEDEFLDKVGTLMFGVGTNLTNDLGHEQLSIVIKPKTANGQPCVKLSDDKAKATGDRSAIDRYLEGIQRYPEGL